MRGGCFREIRRHPPPGGWRPLESSTSVGVGTMPGVRTLPESLYSPGATHTRGRHDATVSCPSFAAIRKTGRFKNFVRNAGYVDYWRANGWPDLCRPMGTDDFACD